jgi:hypothetical protein
VRNVAWYESRQERAASRRDRFKRALASSTDRAAELDRKARKSKGKRRGSLEAAAAAAWAKARKLVGRLDTMGHATSSRYGRAKGRVGRHTSYGWVDR